MAKRTPRTDPQPIDSGQFPTTAWSLIGRAKDHRQSAHFAAIDHLICKYWKPVFYFIRAKGYPLDRAEDLTQEFFAQFLQRDWIRRVDPQRGRFRTFMLTIVVRFLADQSPSRTNRQNRLEREMVAISTLVSDEERRFEPSAGESPESIFMRRWSRALVDHVRHEIRLQCADEGQLEWYELFEASLMPGDQRNSQVALAERFGLTRDQVRYRLEQIRERFRRSFRHELRVDGCSESHDEELQELMNSLAL